ncbi:unnamed protein product [Callosobruchus maculatus]|uniref:PiggyBac transposable element-derived protein 4 C-terminal zinc-ribbon domain-containing protein n=1 Tax=Callosobruchus maculatus TaxID=64391 RepID=A0A653C929_CALMS|nr:unnamed protein product [Callosobruchus maculatus]
MQHNLKPYWIVFKSICFKRMQLKNIPRLLKEKCRMILNIEEPSTSAEVQEAKGLKIGNGRCYLFPRKTDKRTRNYCSACIKWICLEHKKRATNALCYMRRKSKLSNFGNFRFSSYLYELHVFAFCLCLYYSFFPKYVSYFS